MGGRRGGSRRFRGKKDLARKGARGWRAEQYGGGRGAERSGAAPLPGMGRAPARALPAAPPAAPAAM